MFVVPETIEVVTAFDTIYNYPINLGIVATFCNNYIDKDHDIKHHIIEFRFSKDYYEYWEFETKAECNKEFRRLHALVVHESHWKE